MSQIAGSNSSYKPITNTAWVRARLFGVLEPLSAISLRPVLVVEEANISAISLRPVLMVEEARVPGENHRPWKKIKF
jgi:hypothetical protein